MFPFYIIRSNQYARMSKSFYEEFLAAKKLYDSVGELKKDDENPIINAAKQYVYHEQMDDAAVAAVIFQALSIEAYINLWGICVFGESTYYDKKTRIERLPFEKKLMKILDEVGMSLPSTLLTNILALMEKRNSLVHQKPKAIWIGVDPYNYEKPEENYRDINEFILEKQVAQENIDAEMKLYEQLQEAVKVIRNSDKELIEEIQDGLRGYSIFDNEEGKM